MTKISDKPLYTAGVASEIINVNQKTMINYEVAGLIKTSKSQGGRRLYSKTDLYTILIIRWLIINKGLNMKGIALLLKILEESKRQGVELLNFIIPEKEEQKILHTISV